MKFHIRLRTISLLISTHNTQVYVQWMPYLFVWLYLLKCVFICSIFVDSNTKRFLSILGVFGKYFVFTKTKKFQKRCCPVLATQSRVIQVACYSCELACWFWRLVCKWRVQSWGVHKDFRSSARDSLAGRPSSHEKHLENFSQFCLWVFWRLDLATCWRLTSVAKNACFAFRREFLKFFSVFSLEVLWLFTVFPISLSTKSDPNTPCHTFQSPFLHHSFSIFEKQVWVFSVSLDFFMFWEQFSFCWVITIDWDILCGHVFA